MSKKDRELLQAKASYGSLVFITLFYNIIPTSFFLFRPTRKFSILISRPLDAMLLFVNCGCDEEENEENEENEEITHEWYTY
jgi:hypothetical protein